jgi:hypothetical protein
MPQLRRWLFRSLLVVTLLVSAAYSPQKVGACPDVGRYETHYDYGWSLNQIGWRDYHCGCGVSGDGDTNGLWKVTELYDCDTFMTITTNYYGRCNPGDPWSLRSGPTDYPNWC